MAVVCAAITLEILLLELMLFMIIDYYSWYDRIWTLRWKLFRETYQDCGLPQVVVVPKFDIFKTCYFCCRRWDGICRILFLWCVCHSLSKQFSFSVFSRTFEVWIRQYWKKWWIRTNCTQCDKLLRQVIRCSFWQINLFKKRVNIKQNNY